MDAFARRLDRSRLKRLPPRAADRARRPAPVPDLFARHPACRRRVLPRLQPPSRAGRPDLRRRPADASRVLEAYSVEAAHTSQRHHHLPQPVAAAARRQPVRASDCSGSRDLLEVDFPISRQASVQSRDLRHHLRAHFSSRHVGIARPVGPGFCDCGMGDDAGHAGDESRAPRRHQLDVSRVLSWRARASRRISRQSLGRVDASAGERRAAAVRVLHDFRSDDRPQRSPRKNRARRAGRRARVCVAGPALPHQRTHLGFVYRGAMRSAVGRDLARAQIRMDTKWRWPCFFGESRFSFR